ncbi:Glyoxalase-like domain protein [Tritonibacter multivorans]|uniref:Bleomycin resistance protein n=1 Tax=Tritonibacter multivorans TaxID=928856 RepID=A0A0N7M0J1_9RHOB|nr:VOC family protein [Tritonibacter multivorans]MDA7420861.1 VOC family protein [Tritonibacter multivorans]CUH80609.1 Glyoxalase-like domain protein [Tritonibacter multivorans]SFC84258.1 Uncharacterized conserved protein PhnB, glyoxalase superfamily [Tritonibacter multivorans]
MTDKSLVQAVTPFVLCSDLNAQVAFYQRCLGFEMTFQADNYAFLRHGGAGLRLLECPENEDGTPLGHNQSFYIDVTDVDGLYAQLKPALDGLPEGRVRAPFDQDYGQREFHVLDEDGALVFFGMAL